MSALALLSLLGLVLFLPAFMDASDVDSGGDEEELPPVEPEVVNGTEGADMLTAQSGEVVNGLGGNDTLVTAEGSDGATINGNTGNDTLELNGTNATATGGIGNDTIDSRYILNGVAEGGDGDDEITFYPLRPSDALNGTETEDTSSANGGAGDDQITVQGPLDLVEGGDGNDFIRYNSSTEGGGLTLSGGAGDDVIVHLTLNATPEHLNSLTIDAGEVDDRLLSSANIGPDADNSGDTLTGSSGADSFELTFHHPDLTEPSRDAGIITTITDFDPAEDSLLLVEDFQSGQESRVSLPSPARITGFELVEAADGSFTDVIFQATATDTGSGTVTGTIHLAGTTGLTAANIQIGPPNLTTTV